MYNKVENPTEYGTVQRQNQTLSFHNNVVLLTDNDYGEYISPMQIFDMKKSKWKINYASSKECDGEDVNINITQIPKLWSDTETCNYILANLKINQGKQEIPEEMKVVINFLPNEMSEGKGLTAIQLAKEYSYELCCKAVTNLYNEANKGGRYAEKNLNQANVLRYATLCVNAQKYKHNGKTLGEIINSSVDEIKNALNSIADPKVKAILGDIVSYVKTNLDHKRDVRKSLLLNLGPMESGSSYVLLDEFKTPNNKKTDENGLAEGKHVKITCNFGAEYPYHITIESMKGKPLDGQVGISLKNASNFKSFTFKLLQWEWTHILHQEKTLLDGLIYANVNNAYQKSCDFARQNRSTWKKKSENVAARYATAPQMSQEYVSYPSNATQQDVQIKSQTNSYSFNSKYY